MLYTEHGSFEVGHIDLLMFGSPCQTFSIAMKTDRRIGLEDKQKSGLFFECFRILQEVNSTFFLMENVASIKKDDKAFITKLMGVEPIRINSKLVSAQLRDRLYWTNIPNVSAPDDKGIKLKDILTSGYTDREKARALLVSDSRPLKDPKKMLHRYQDTGFTTIVWEELGNNESIRYMNQTELERCQTVPEGYTSCLTRNQAADVLGDGWTVDVIAHIFTNLREENPKMELKVKEFTLPEAIDFNFDELKQELKERMQYYENAVYTEDQTAAAKKDLALLRKFNKALSDERIRIKKQILTPYEEFEAKIKVLDGIVSKSINNIDGQLKSYEKQRREKKLEEILHLFNELETPVWLQPQMIFKDRWLNATVKMSAIEKEINAVLEQIDKDMATLADLPEYSFEAIEEYKKSFSLANAIQAAQRAKETALRKAAAEQAAKTSAPAVTPIELQPAAAQPKQAEKVWLNFTALLSTEDAIALKDFFKSRNIAFHKI